MRNLAAMAEGTDFFRSCVPGIALWVLMYLGCMWLNIACRRAYLALGGEYMVEEGYASDPRRATSARQLLSFPFIGQLMAYILGLVTASAVDRELRAPGVFEFALGGAMLLQTAMLRRGALALIRFRSLPTSGVTGKLIRPRADSFRMSAAELAAFALILLLLAVILESPFCFGGFTFCLWVAVGQYRLAKHAARAAPAA